MEIEKLFDDYLMKKGIKLSNQQRCITELVINLASSNNLVKEFLGNEMTGKTFLFNLLDDFFSSVKILDVNDIGLANKDRFILEYASSKCTN